MNAPVLFSRTMILMVDMFGSQNVKHVNDVISINLDEHEATINPVTLVSVKNQHVSVHVCLYLMMYTPKIFC